MLPAKPLLSTRQYQELHVHAHIVNVISKEGLCGLIVISAGGGIASDEDSLGLPLIVNDLESIRPHLNFFVHLYGLNCVSIPQLCVVIV